MPESKERYISPRQRISLSDEAQHIIDSDTFSFTKEGTIDYSKFVCKIFLTHVDKSKAKNGDVEEIKRLLQKKPRSAKDCKSPVLNPEVCLYLRQEDIYQLISKEPYSKDSQKAKSGKFIKAVLEEYAELPAVKRALIYFNDIVDKINSNFDMNTERYYQRTKKLKIVTGSTTLIVKPVALMTGRHSLYNYLLGFYKRWGALGEFEMDAIRLSAIDYVEVLEEDADLGSLMVDALFEAAEERGVPFVKNPVWDIEIRLTTKGKQIYNSVLFQRPKVVKVEGDVYHFRCTLVQANVYFVGFGAEAEVIRPDSLRSDIAEHFAMANAV